MNRITPHPKFDEKASVMILLVKAGRVALYRIVAIFHNLKEQRALALIVNERHAHNERS